MAVTIYAWTHNQKSIIDNLLRKSNCGHCSLEISGTKENIKNIEKFLQLQNPEYIRSLKLVENFTHTPQQIDLFMKNATEEEKIIARENDLTNCLSIYEDNQNSGLSLGAHPTIPNKDTGPVWLTLLCQSTAYLYPSRLPRREPSVPVGFLTDDVN